MKTMFCIFFIVTFANCFCQNLHADEKKALVMFTLKNLSGEAFQTELVLYSSSTKKSIIAKTNQEGKGKVLLPVNSVYVAYVKTCPGKYEFQIPDYPNLQFNQEFIFDNSKMDQLHPTPIQAVVNLTIINPKSGFLQEEINIRGTTTPFSLDCVSNNKGFVQIHVPIDEKYAVSFSSAKDYSSFTIPNQSFYILDKEINFEGSKKSSLHPSTKKALFRITYINLDDKPVSGDTIIVRDSYSGKEYKEITDTEGQAQILAPVGAKYDLSTSCFMNFTEVEVPDKQEKFIFEYRYKNISSKELKKRREDFLKQAIAAEERWKKEEEDRKRQKQVQDSIWLAEEKERIRQEKLEALLQQKRQDSIAHIEEKRETALKEAIELEQQIQDSLTKIAEKQEKKEAIRHAKWAAEYESKYDRNKTKKVIFTVMKRNNWKKRLFVVDVTGSMYAYVQQIKNWYILNFSQEDTSHFVFFNDGDDKTDWQKTVGSTGGIYFCENCGILQIERMLNIASKWDGGDIPENDIEALLTATDSITSYKELILLADNKSPVRDYVLLKQFNCPVRVVLCGVSDDIINEQYLNIAYATKGSVHTIEQDIQFLRELLPEDEIIIGKRKYLFLNDGFVRYN